MAGLEQPRRQHQPVGAGTRDCHLVSLGAPGAGVVTNAVSEAAGGVNQQTRPAFVKQRARMLLCRSRSHWTTSRSTGQDCCFATKPAFRRCSIEAPLAIELDEQEACRTVSGEPS